jgi:hypothetical protein
MTEHCCTASGSTGESYCYSFALEKRYMTAKERPMNGTNQERWVKLCEQAKREHDPQKLSVLFAKIDGMLQERQDRRNGLNRQ